MNRIQAVAAAPVSILRPVSSSWSAAAPVAYASFAERLAVRRLTGTRPIRGGTYVSRFPQNSLR